MANALNDLLSRKLKLATAALVFQRLWSAAFYAMMVAGLFLLLLLMGVFSALPSWARLPSLFLFACVFLASLLPFLRFRWPTRIEVLRRIEIHSSLAHRPLLALHDRMVDQESFPESAFLWQEHKKRLAASIRALKTGLPRSDWITRDPYALRNGLALALIAVIALKGADWRTELNRPITRKEAQS